MNPDAELEQRPHIVVESLRDGETRERYFPSRKEAALYLWSIPGAQAANELNDIASARIVAATVGMN